VAGSADPVTMTRLDGTLPPVVRWDGANTVRVTDDLRTIGILGRV
jgi:hypothetical protein